MQIPTYEKDIQGESWLGGPTHHLQRQHVPKYGGHVHGLIAENVFGRPFAKITGDCLNERVETGFIIGEKKRLQTIYGTSFLSDERDKPKEVLKKTADAVILGMSTKLQELQKKVVEPEELAPIDRLPVVGYQGFRPVYRNPVKKHKEPTKEELTTLKQLEEFEALPEKVKMTALESEFKNLLEPPKIPVVGYTGFVKGQKAKNMYGQSFKDVATLSKTTIKL